MLHVTHAVDRKFRTRDGNPREPRRSRERARGLARKRIAHERAGVLEIRQQLALAELAARVLADEFVAALRMEALVRCPRVLGPGGVEIGAVERVVRDMPELVLRDLRVNKEVSSLLDNVYLVESKLMQLISF